MKKTEKKVISIMLVMVMLVAMLVPSISSAATGEVTIKDSKLKKAIAEQADVNNDGIITEEEMKKLEYIDIPEGVTDLTGVEYATNLEITKIKYNDKMPDLSKVSSTAVHVDISDATTTVKLDFLKNVKKLSVVCVFSNDERDSIGVDYSALSEIKMLQCLNLGRGVSIQSVKELGHLDNLLCLEVEGNSGLDEMLDLNGIGDLKILQQLTIRGKTVQNVSELGKVTNLAILHFENVNGISDLSALSNSEQLTHVEICSTDLSDLSFLKNKQQLEYLSIIDSPIKYMQDRKTLLQLIPTLPNLQSLYINVEDMKLESLAAYKEWEDFFTANELEEQNSNPVALEKTQEETKTETKKQAEKPTVIPQAGVNVVGNAISILVAISVFLLAAVFVKAKRK